VVLRPAVAMGSERCRQRYRT